VVDQIFRCRGFPLLRLRTLSLSLGWGGGRKGGKKGKKKRRRDFAAKRPSEVVKNFLILFFAVSGKRKIFKKEL